MALDTDFVTQELVNSNFNIIDMVTDPETEDVVLKVIHDIHPDSEVVIKLVTSKGDKDVMEMVFEGPDEYTDEETKQVLQEVMDFLVQAIEKALDEQPNSVMEEIPEEGESSDGNN
jgi:hypothetical protein